MSESWAESFPLEICPTCGYSLKGLPPDGNCPECGVAYDSSQIVLYGWARGAHVTGSNSRGIRWIWPLLPSGFVVFTFLTHQTSQAVKLAFLAFWMLSAGLSVWFRKQNDHPGGVQVRLNAHGVVQIDNLPRLRNHPIVDENRYTPWNKIRWDKWTFLDDGKLHLKLAFSDAWFSPTYPVNAEIDCSPEKAEKLRALIRSWRGEHDVQSLIA